MLLIHLSPAVEIIFSKVTVRGRQQNISDQLNRWWSSSPSAFKKSAQFIYSFLSTADIRVSWTNRPRPFLTMLIQKSLNQLLAFLNLYQHFKVPWPDWPYSLLTLLCEKNFDLHLIFVNLYQHAKNQLFHLLILQIHSVLEPCHQIAHTHFWPCHPQNFQSPFNLHEFVPACKK